MKIFASFWGDGHPTAGTPPAGYGDIGAQISGQDRGQTQKKLGTYPRVHSLVKLDAYDVIVGGSQNERVNFLGSPESVLSYAFLSER